MNLPMKMDLNKKDTVNKVIKYCITVLKNIIPHNNTIDDVVVANDIPIMNQVRIAMAGDGSPIISGQNI